VAAGAVLTGLLVPAGMGYAEAAGLPPVTGLYTTVVSLVAYAAVGPSRILILGPDSSLAPIIAAAVAPLALAGTDRAIALGGLLALMTGAVLVIAGILRLGLLTDLLSRPIRVGYLHGLAATLIVSQLPTLFGFDVDAGDLPAVIAEFVRGVTDGDTDAEALVLGAGTLLSVVVLQRVAPSVPGLLVGVVGATAVVWMAGLDDEVDVVGALPRGLPAPALGGLDWGDAWSLLPAALGMALLASAETAVLSRSLGDDHLDPVDESQEMAALGLANVACGALGGFPTSASMSRTPVAARSGARSQVTGLVGAALVALLLLLLPGATAMLPSSALAAVVILAASSLADPRQIWSLWRARPLECGLAIVSFLGVVLFGVLPGIGVAVVLSVVAFVGRAWWPHRVELVRLERRKGYHDLERHPEGERIPGLVIARFDAPLFFANARIFSRFVHDLVDEAPGPPAWVVIAAEPITDVDTTAADELVALDDDLAASGIKLAFAELKGPVRDRLASYGLRDRFGDDRFFPTVGTAVNAYLLDTGTEWTDWTDLVDDEGNGT
jgi:high affinity sulfate transporter 1